MTFYDVEKEINMKTKQESKEWEKYEYFMEINVKLIQYSLSFRDGDFMQLAKITTTVQLQRLLLSTVPLPLAALHQDRLQCQESALVPASYS